MVLARDPLCTACQAEGVVREATQVDHIVARSQGGRDELENLQGLCEEHHRAKTAQESGSTPRRRWVEHQITPAQVPVTIVAGPPGSGKTTYVQERMRPGDLVVDVDTLYMALSGLPMYDKPAQLLPFVCEARDAVIARLGRASQVGRAWIITGEPEQDKLRQLKHDLQAERLLVMDVSAGDCRRRLGGDARRADGLRRYYDLVDEWFEKYHASESDRRERSAIV